jgi:hypothetical protein
MAACGDGVAKTDELEMAVALPVSSCFATEANVDFVAEIHRARRKQISYRQQSLHFTGNLP